jgi:hypothetical protein
MVALVTCLFVGGPLHGMEGLYTVRLSLKAGRPRVGIVQDEQKFIYQATEAWAPQCSQLRMEFMHIVGVHDKVYDEEDY